jgi:hypothetical protein
MKFSHLLLFAAGMPLLASAQADQAMPAAADPNAPVSPLQYHSVFGGYVAAKEPTRSPDKAWVPANRALMGETGEATASNAPPAPGVSDKTSEPQPMPDKREHKGAHH